MFNVNDNDNISINYQSIKQLWESNTIEMMIIRVNCLLLRRWREFVLIPTVNHFRDASHLVTKPSSSFDHENFRQMIRKSWAVKKFPTGKGLSGLCGVVSKIASGGGGGGSAIPA